MMDNETSISSVSWRASEWLTNAAWPLWLDRGVDRVNGGYFDSLSLDTAENASPFKRLRVLTRQIYVAAAAAKHGIPGAKETCLHGMAFLLGPARHPQGGFANRFDLSGQVIDPSRDLYDLAFCLFALGQAYTLDEDASFRDEATALLDFILTSMRHPACGFIEAVPPRLPRRQNPHMHLLEAALFWETVWPRGPFGSLCDELVDLFRRHFFHPATGSLIEYFDDVLQPAPGMPGLTTEPGHHFEWTWLLANAEKLRGCRLTEGAILYCSAHARGIDSKTGLVFGEVKSNGETRLASTRLWPHTEWIKAELVAPGADRAGRVAQAWTALESFFGTPTRGLWYDRWDADRSQFVHEPAPASSLYHITLAILELAAASDQEKVERARARLSHA